MKKLLLNFCLIVTTSSFAQSTSKIDCNTTNFQELKVDLINTTLKLPTYSTIDSSKRGELEGCLLKYVINSNDKSLNTEVTVYNVSDYPDQIMEQVMEGRGKMILEGMDFEKDFTLIYDSLLVINNIKVGIIKFKLKGSDNKLYALMVYFFIGKKQVNINFQETVKEGVTEKNSLAECIVKTLIFY